MTQSEQVRVIHKPELKNPWIVQIENYKGKWINLNHYPTQAAAQKARERAIAARSGVI